MTTWRDVTAPDSGDEAVAERLAREARIVGLHRLEMPSLEAVERRRLQLWTLTSVVLVLLAFSVLLTVWAPRAVGHVLTPLILRVAVVTLTVGFSIYCLEKEVHLRRIARLLIDERLLSTALSSRVRELTLLLEAGKAVNSGLELDKVLASILTSAVELLEASSGSIMLVEAQELWVVTAAGNDAAQGARLPIGEGIAGRVAASREPLLITGEAAKQRPGARSVAVDSAMSCPLVHRDELLGVINVNAPRERSYSEYELRALSLFAEQAASTLAAGRLYERERANAERLEHMAFHDPLTGLANRALFVDRAAQALARSGRFPGTIAVMFIDLDRFKFVNDNFGHAAGDDLLAAVAERLRSVLRPSDTVARFGGDEFVVLCEGLAGEIEAVGLASRLIDSMSAPFSLACGEIALSGSAGVALASGPGDDPAALLRDADTAMYRAKGSGRNRYEVFNGALRARTTERLRVENSLRHALANGWLRLDFQPVVDLDTGKACAAEALVRLDDPEQGMILPKSFLDIASESSLMLQVGAWVVERACRASADWNAEMPVAVNLSAREIANPELVDLVTAALDRAGLAPARLAVEVDESTLAELGDAGIAALRALGDVGVVLGIDDFGTGYSALASLRRLAFSYVKIARDVVHALPGGREDEVIVEAIINLGNALGLDVVAKGVETERHLRRLRQLGCRLGQGWYLGEPGPGVLTGDRPARAAAR